MNTLNLVIIILGIAVFVGGISLAFALLNIQPIGVQTTGDYMVIEATNTILEQLNRIEDQNAYIIDKIELMEERLNKIEETLERTEQTVNDTYDLNS